MSISLEKASKLIEDQFRRAKQEEKGSDTAQKIIKEAGEKCLKFIADAEADASPYASLDLSEYSKTIFLVNKALCYALNVTEFCSIYGIRGMCSLFVKNVEGGLRNAELERQINHPEPTLLKTADIITKELEKIKLQDQDRANGCPVAAAMKKIKRKVFELTYAPHPKIPWIADCLKMNATSSAGVKNHLVATKALEVGDVIAIEEPLLSSLSESKLAVQCNNCLVTSPLTLIPCPHCTSVMFCSDMCLEAAQNHRYECNAISRIIQCPSIMNDSNYATVRAFIKVAASFDGSVETMSEYFKANEGKTIFDFDFNDRASPENVKNLAVVIHNQTQTAKPWSTCNCQQKANVRLIQKVAECYPSLDQIWKCHKCKSDALQFLEKLSKNIYKSGTNKICGIHPLDSMFQHSCAPNISEFMRIDGRLVYVVAHPIQINETLTTNRFGAEFHNSSKSFRLESVFDNSGDVCSCVACKCDYPVEKKLKTHDSKMLKIVEKDSKLITELNADEIFSLLIEYQNYINENFSKYPNKEMLFMERSIEHLYFQLDFKTTAFDMFGNLIYD